MILSTTDHTRIASIQEIENTKQTSLNSNIPVVDLSLYSNTSTHKEFLESLEKGLKFGFFAVKNSSLDIETVKNGYATFKEFFESSKEQKMVIHDPEVRGQRGYLFNEKALGNNTADHKEYLHIGSENSPFPNIWPKHMDLKGPSMQLYNSLKDVGYPILEGIAMVLGQRADFFTEMTHNGENLMRALHYFSNPQVGVVWAEEHTDIDKLTFLPYASDEGLEVEIDGKWIPVFLGPEDKDSLVVNVGDMLEAYSNGLFPSCKHRVRCTKPDTERYSVVYFIHPNDNENTIVGPLPNTGNPKYPYGKRLEYLFLRLFSNGQLTNEASQDVINGAFIKKIEELVIAGKAADSVERWYDGYKKSLDHMFKELAQRVGIATDI